MHVGYKGENWKVGMPQFEMRSTPATGTQAEMDAQRAAILAPPRVPFWFGVQPDFLTGSDNDNSMVICESRGYCADEYADYKDANEAWNALSTTDVTSINYDFDKFKKDYGNNPAASAAYEVCAITRRTTHMPHVDPILGPTGDASRAQ